MAAKLEKTKTPGIYKRGGRYAFSYRVDGKQRWESCRTLDEARRRKAARATDIARGEFEQRSTITLHEYAREWVQRYQGRGRRGFRENTREEYERILDRYILRKRRDGKQVGYFSDRVRLTEITPSKVAAYVAWLCAQERPAPTKKDPDRVLRLSDSAVRKYMVPLRACLSTAAREGLIRSNPARDIDLPHRPSVEVEEDEANALTADDLALVIGQLPERWRLLFRFLAATGVRISEAIALRWSDLDLESRAPRVRVRRALVKGHLGPPKSRYGRRDVPIHAALAAALAQARSESEWSQDHDLVFPAGNGQPLMPRNLRGRVLKPAAQKAGVPWIGFHTFRHTCASLLFAEGRNAVQVQRWLGHHSAAFTLATYVHLLDDDAGEPLDLGF